MNSKHQLESIQSMLVAGHRCVHLEAHTLLLWGLGGGAIVAFTEYVISIERFPDVTQRAAALLLWLAFWLAALAWFDHRLTRHRRAERDETLPFAQAQISRAWWMLLVLGTLGSFAMHFFGGGSMIYAMWIVLLGLGIYLFGLFSRPLTEWIGLATLLLGVAGLAAGIPFGVTHWLAAACFGIGLPLAGLLLHRVDDGPLPKRAAALALWLILVATPPLLISRLSSTRAPEGTPRLSLASMLATGVPDKSAVLVVPTGTLVPMRVEMHSPMVSIAEDAALGVTLTTPVEILLENGQPEGRYRMGEGPWHTVHDGVLFLRISKLEPRIENGKPVIRAVAEMNLQGDKP